MQDTAGFYHQIIIVTGRMFDLMPFPMLFLCGWCSRFTSKLTEKFVVNGLILSCTNIAGVTLSMNELFHYVYMDYWLVHVIANAECVSVIMCT